MRWLDGIINLLIMDLSELQELERDRKPGMLQSMRLQVRHDCVTELRSKSYLKQNIKITNSIKQSKQNSHPRAVRHYKTA